MNVALAADLDLDVPVPAGVELDAVDLGDDVDPLRRVAELSLAALVNGFAVTNAILGLSLALAGCPRQEP